LFNTTKGFVYNRVTTCLENLEMSGNLKQVREMSGMLLTVGIVREKILSWKSVPKLFITIYLTLTPEVLATVYLSISISLKNSA